MLNNTPGGGLPFATALDKAEMELRDAINIVNKQDKKKKEEEEARAKADDAGLKGDVADFTEGSGDEESSGNQAAQEQEEDTPETRKARAEAAAKEAGDSGKSTMYGFAPELSRSSAIENSRDDLASGDQQNLLDAVLNQKKSGVADILAASGTANATSKEEEDTPETRKARAEAAAKEAGESGKSNMYGFAPELSRSSAIENSRDELDDAAQRMLDAVLGEKRNTLLEEIEEEKKHQAPVTEKDRIKAAKKQARDKLDDMDLLDEAFHGGYESLSERGRIHRDLVAKTNKTFDEMLLAESEEYDIKSFDEGREYLDQDSEENLGEIAPTTFSLKSFEDDDEDDIEPYDVNEGLLLGEIQPPDSIEEELAPLPPEPPKIDPEEEAAKIIAEARERAASILEEARANADEVLGQAREQVDAMAEESRATAHAEGMKKGYEEGYKKGEKEGFEAAENAVNQGMLDEAAEFRQRLVADIEGFEKRLDNIIDENMDQLTDLAMNVAEKVIKVSLKSSKDVISGMIMAAAEDCRNKEWAKVYISHEDKAIAMNLESDLIDALKQISENVKVVVMDDEPSGTCIIESPDQIVDASADVQLDNIRQIVKDNK